jgi:hypothetical protein
MTRTQLKELYVGMLNAYPQATAEVMALPMYAPGSVGEELHYGCGVGAGVAAMALFMGFTVDEVTSVTDEVTSEAAALLAH